MRAVECGRQASLGLLGTLSPDQGCPLTLFRRQPGARLTGHLGFVARECGHAPSMSVTMLAPAAMAVLSTDMNPTISPLL